MIFFPDIFKYAILRLNCLICTLEQHEIITFQDKVRLLGPRYRQKILQGQEGHDHIAQLIKLGRPLMISRLGAVELSCLRFYLEKRCTTDKPFNEKIRFQMSNNAGFFPVDDASLDTFSKLFLDKLKQVDIMGVWFNKYEDVICNEHCKDADLVELGCLEPFSFTNPWSALLAGKKVLIIHPFVESIRKQYTEKRRVLFASPDVLPDFELKTIKAVQSIAGTKVDYATWFDGYHYMCDEIAKVDFDICLIGAGAYGLPLASFVKQLGKQAIHMGGMTQILFGIKGKRWEELYSDTIATLFNEHWIRPSPEETPSRKDKVENGCYW
jgi:hypothetical protein